MNNDQYRELTEDEKNDLPMEVKICFQLHPWNISANIHSLEDWLEKMWFGWTPSDSEDMSLEESQEAARKEMRRMYDLALDFIRLERARVLKLVDAVLDGMDYDELSYFEGTLGLLRSAIEGGEQSLEQKP